MNTRININVAYVDDPTGVSVEVEKIKTAVVALNAIEGVFVFFEKNMTEAFTSDD